MGGVGHIDGLTNPRAWRGRCRAGFSNTGGPSSPRKRASFTKKCPIQVLTELNSMLLNYFQVDKYVQSITSSDAMIQRRFLEK